MNIKKIKTNAFLQNLAKVITIMTLVAFSFNVALAIAPDAINDLVANAGNGEVDLTWTAPNDNGTPITDYEIHYSTDDFVADDQTFADGVSTNTTATVTGLTNELEYAFRVFAFNDELGPASNTETAKPSICKNLAPGTFCASQIVQGHSTLSFINIPDTFTFTSISLSGSVQSLFNNTTPVGANDPALEDELTVEDTRNAGGFEVQVDINAAFSDGTNTIAKTNLFTVTSLEETDPGNVNNLTYESGFAGDQNVSVPLYVDVDSTSIDVVATYTGLAPDSQFGSGAIVLLDGPLVAASGRDGQMSTFVNFYLSIPALQPAGEYDANLTYTLLDDTI